MPKSVRSFEDEVKAQTQLGVPSIIESLIAARVKIVCDQRGGVLDGGLQLHASIEKKLTKLEVKPDVVTVSPTGEENKSFSPGVYQKIVKMRQGLESLEEALNTAMSAEPNLVHQSFEKLSAVIGKAQGLAKD